MVLQAFCPQFERIDNAVTIRDILVFHEDHVAGLKEEFTGGDLSFALSCEIWGTSYHRMSYLCVAAHYVDGDHILNKRVISFKLIDGAPTAEAMARRILDVAMEYGIENRIVSVTLGDGLADAETMDALAPLLGWYTGGFVFLQRCIFSILNDIVRAGLTEMAEPLDAIRSAIAYVSSSEANFAEFEKCCVERGQKARKLWPDSKVRWDSTYDMLKEVLPYKEVLTDFVNGNHVAGLKEEFTGGDLSFALSCEIWGTSYHRMSYLCVAAHYVDGDHILNKRVISFKLIDGAPTAEAMARRILDVAMEYGIENRIVSVTLGDGLADAETMDALAPLLGWYTGGFVFLQRCIFSILNDIVRAGLTEMAEPLDAIRSAIAYVSSSEANFAEFEKCCVERGQKARKLWPDSKVRWDSHMTCSKKCFPTKKF
ncbi:hypothetical protein OsJ_17632 [Oryza sativa Japonica Group]|uniref:Uncharacterized protein n=1 Tax=Oryza sativa subsp. japonica TaxID=39947 RepID=B9FN83_ORYSJ|nr:hypothetical protein OsJ_17632 [Oryza sativa Japonica Group]